MAKFLNRSQIIGEKGVATFHDYCANHNPPILWREETKNDFGIDGEIELVKTNDEGKLEVTGEILKVQIKSTETGSYISNETDLTFEFMATKEDVKYWSNHKLSVVLIIYFVKEQKLYAKKVEKLDYEKSKKRLPILFQKDNYILTKNENSFLTKFSEHFKERINFDISEILYTNIFRFNKLPQFIFEYKSKVSNKQKIYDSDIDQFPVFILHSSKLYSFTTLDHFPEFCNQFLLEQSPKQIYFKDFFNSKETRNYSIELLNKYFKDFCYKKGIGFNKDYYRFFFKKFLDKPIEESKKATFTKEVYRKEKYIPKLKSRKEIEREVVTRYVYYEKTSFIRHFAFEIYYFSHYDNIYISITPKYLFTSDGKSVLEDKKKITKYTNYLTSREFNQQVLNHIYFVFQYLSDNKDFVSIADFDNCKISISKMEKYKVPFGISLYKTSSSIKNEMESDENIQKSLFDIDENNTY